MTRDNKVEKLTNEH